MKEKIEELASIYKEDLTEFLRDIVSIPSMNGDEGAVILRIEKEMNKLEYDEVWIDGLGNLFGRIGNGSRLLVIDGHTDTVGVGNPENWTVDPFSAEIKDGFLYGRGAADQKGGLASAVYAGKIVKEAGIPDDVSLIVAATVLEEDQEGISWQFILEEKNVFPDAVLLTEPSELGIRIGQRGRVEIKIETKGVSSHGSAPDRGENAIYKMAPVIKEIEQLNGRLKDDKILGKASITISEIKSTAPSLCAVADSASVHLDRRLTTGETFETAIEEIRNLDSVRKSGAKVSCPDYNVLSYTGQKKFVKAYFPTWLMDKNDPLVHAAGETFVRLYNKEPEIGTWVFSTNGVTTKGIYDIPTIGFGPGEERYAHAPDERIRIDEVVSAVAFYAIFVRLWGDKRL